jgi:hypothetical protein
MVASDVDIDYSTSSNNFYTLVAQNRIIPDDPGE